MKPEEPRNLVNDTQRTGPNRVNPHSHSSTIGRALHANSALDPMPRFCISAVSFQSVVYHCCDFIREYKPDQKKNPVDCASAAKQPDVVRSACPKWQTFWPSDLSRIKLIWREPSKSQGPTAVLRLTQALLPTTPVWLTKLPAGDIINRHISFHSYRKMKMKSSLW